MARILVVDDEAGIRRMLDAALSADGHSVRTIENPEEALAHVERDTVDLIVTDLAMPQMTGVELLAKVSEIAPEIPAIVITAYGSKETAIEAMRCGAVNYLEKPFDLEEMRLHVSRALGHRRLSRENRQLKRRLSLEGQLVGGSPAMRSLRELVQRVGQTASSVLVSGESGTGKELVARALHEASPRAHEPFVGVNCGAIPGELLESELFGHEKGAFTGADKARRGLVEAAEKGTLFLDEIGDMPHAMQVKLLRVLQERRIRRVGGRDEIEVDVRLVTATHRDLDEMVRDGRFREDLYYRINVIRIDLPPLRERVEDIPELVQLFAARHAEREGGKPASATPDLLDALARHGWPGNVRELENVVERAIALSPGGELAESVLPPELGGGRKRGGSRGLDVDPDSPIDLESHLEEERGRIMGRALDVCGGVQTRAAEALGMSFRSFRYFAKKYGLTSKGSEKGAARDEECEPVGAGAGRTESD